MRAPIAASVSALVAVCLDVSCAMDGPVPAQGDPTAAAEATTILVGDALVARDALAIPGVASRPATLASGRARIGVSWQGASDVAATRTERAQRAIYRGALRGADLEVAWSDTSFEDSIRFATRPLDPVVRYEIDLDGVAGLRLIDDVVEFLDEGGAPRLRMARAHVDDAAGGRVRATTSIEGCAYSSDPRAPWGAPIVAPGRRRCTIAVRWDDEGVVYPATLDPVWSDASSMAEGRIDSLDRLRLVRIEGTSAHAGKVFVGGGSSLAQTTSASVLESAEVFSPDPSGSGGTWATILPLPEKRRASIQAYVETPTGPGVLVAGGCDAQPCNASTKAWVYDLASGTYSPVDDMPTPRAAAFVMKMADGRILVTGGGGLSGQPIPVTTEIFDPMTGHWSAAASHAMGGRVWGGSAVLADGRFLIGGGRNFIQPGMLATAEVYDPVADTWTFTANDMALDRFFFDFVSLDDGTVLGVGGESQLAALSEVELFDPATMTFSLTGELDEGVVSHATTRLDNGFIAALYGYGTNVIQLYNPAKKTWALGAALPDLWWEMGSTRLADGRVLLAGGVRDAEWPSATGKTMIIAPQPDGEPCVTDGECAAAHCVDGVCCDTACDDACSACSAVRKGGGADGACGAAMVGSEDARCGDASHTCGNTGVCAAGGACAKVVAGASCVGCPVNQIGSCDGAGVCVCVGPHCVDAHSLQTTNGPVVDCSPYLCGEDDCRHSCNTSTDCVDGWLCDATHQCIFEGKPGGTPAPTTPADDGCGCAVVGARDVATATRSAIIGLAYALAALCRRRASARPPVQKRGARGSRDVRVREVALP